MKLINGATNEFNLEYDEVKKFLEKTIEEKGSFKIIYLRSSTIKKIYNVLTSMPNRAQEAPDSRHDVKESKIEKVVYKL